MSNFPADYPAAWLQLSGVWLNKVDHFSWGTALKVSLPKRAKNADTGAWETVDRFDFDAVLAEGVELPAGLAEGDLISLEGYFSTGKIYDKKDGTQRQELKLRGVKNVQVYQSAAKSDAPANSTPAGWSEVDPDDRRKYGAGAPF
jgi:hypothetical protein